MAQALRTAAVAAGVTRASDDLLMVEEEDVARLFHLGLDSLSELRAACERLETVLGRSSRRGGKGVIARSSPKSSSGRSRTFLPKGERSVPMRALVSKERWWQRATDSHLCRFLDRIVAQISAEHDPQADE